MREYLIYAMLIFIPIGILMGYLLHREGLELKYRVIIVSASLAIIISFPIMVGFMGILLAFLVYLAAIFALSWYFIKVSQGLPWYLKQASSFENDEVYVSERLIDSSVIRTLGDIEDEMFTHNNQDNLLEDASTESLIKTNLLREDKSKSGEMHYIDNSEQVDQNQFVESGSEEIIISIMDDQTDYDKTIEVLEESKESIASMGDIADDTEISAAMNADNSYIDDKLDQVDGQPDYDKMIEVLEETEKSLASMGDIADDTEISAAMNADNSYIDDKLDQADGQPDYDKMIEVLEETEKSLASMGDIADDNEISALLNADNSYIDDKLDQADGQPDYDKMIEVLEETEKSIASMGDIADDNEISAPLSADNLYIDDKLDQADGQPDNDEMIEVSEESEESIASIGNIAEDTELPAPLKADNLYIDDKLDQAAALKNTDVNTEDEKKDQVDKDCQTSILEPIAVINPENILVKDQENGEIVNAETNSKGYLTDRLEAAVGREDDSKQIAADNDLIKLESATEYNDLTISEISESANKVEIAGNNPQIDAQESTGRLDENHLNLLIEKGFALKQDQSYYIEAVQLFREASELAMDEELKYLLTMEIVNLYTEIGMYAQAEQVLFSSIGQAYMRTDIIKKIDRQLSYIRLLSVELDRLGLANTPISEVPRMVKMSVDEILGV